MKYLKFCCIVLFVAYSTILLAQSRSDATKPLWLRSLPVTTNNTIIYVTHSAVAKDLETARKLCLDELVSNSGMRKGMFVVSDSKINTQFEQYVENGNMREKVTTTGDFNTSIKTDEVKVYVDVIDEYWERNAAGEYYLTRLYAKSELNHHVFDDITLTTQYGMQGFVRSLVPGWGQIYKGSMAKGLSIIGAEALGIGGIVACYSMKSSYEKFMIEDPRHIEQYSVLADTWTNIGYGCIAFTAAVYIYNLIDAAVAPGGRRVVIKNRSNFALYPAASHDAIGLAFTYKF